MEIVFWAAYVVFVLALVVFLVRKQIKERVLSVRKAALLPIAFLAVGLFADRGLLHRLDSPLATGFLAGGLAIAAVTGVIRARTMTVRITEAGVITKGDRRTVIWWIVSFALRIGVMVLAAWLGAPEGMGEAMLFAAVTFGAQNLVLAQRGGLLGARVNA